MSTSNRDAEIKEIQAAMSKGRNCRRRHNDISKPPFQYRIEGMLTMMCVALCLPFIIMLPITKDFGGSFLLGIVLAAITMIFLLFKSVKTYQSYWYD